MNGRFGLFIGVFLFLLCATALIANAQQQADALLRLAFGKLGNAKSYSASLKAVTSQGGSTLTLTGTLRAMKPNFLAVELSGAGEKSKFVSNGKRYRSVVPGSPNRTIPVEPLPKSFTGPWEGEVDAFFGGANSANTYPATFQGTSSVNGVSCAVVRVVMQNPVRKITYHIGEKDYFIHRATLETQETGVVVDNTLTKIVIDAPIPKSVFELSEESGNSLEGLRTKSQYTPGRVPTPTDLRTMTLSGLDGKRSAFPKFMEGKSGVLLVFWYAGMAKAQVHMATLKRFESDPRLTSVALVLVNVGNSPGEINTAIASSGLRSTIVIDRLADGGLVSRQFRIEAFPSVVLLNSSFTSVFASAGILVDDVMSQCDKLRSR